MTYTLARSKHSTFGYGTISISLPSLPFDLPPPATDETAPRAPIIKGDLTPELRRWLRGAGRAAGVVIKAGDLK